MNKRLIIGFILVILLSCSGFIFSKDTADYQQANIKGYKLMKQGKYKQAISYLKRSIKLKSSYSLAYNNLGSAYYNLGNYEQAIKQFNKAIKLKKNYTKAYINLSACYFWQGDFFAAYKYYRKGKQIDEKYVRNRIKIEKARNKVEKKLEKDPDNEKLKKVYKKLNQYDSISELEEKAAAVNDKK